MNSDSDAVQHRLLSHVATIKLAIQLLERQTPCTERQRALLERALDATDQVTTELREQQVPWRDSPRS